MITLRLGACPLGKRNSAFVAGHRPSLRDRLLFLVSGVLLLLVALAGAGLLPTMAMAQETESAKDSSEALLEKAVQVKLAASSMADLEEVVQLCETALSKGLSEGDKEFAKSLITSTLHEHAYRIGQSIFERDPPPRRWPLLRRLALRDLETALDYDDQYGDAHLLIARLQLLPGGDRERGKAAAEEAVRLLVDDNQRRSQALVTRARYSEDTEQSIADYGEAIRLDPQNVDAWRGRGTHFLVQGELEKAIEDFLKLLELDEADVGALQAVATALTTQRRLDEALEYATKAIELNPDAAVPYKLRAQVHSLRGDVKKAVDDVTRALKNDPGDIGALLMRARLWQEQNQLDYAKADVARVLDLRPGMPQAILVRSLLAATEERYSDAIADLSELLKADPDNEEIRLQIAAFHYQDDKPSKAVSVCTEILNDNEESWQALRLRGDALLLLGQHAKAIADYETALKSNPEDSSVLNNLAWVLATSPQDEVRDGQRSVELATRACEVTEYEAAHILSTLAAAYAETGDFEKAMEWSDRAVKRAREDLESRQNQPREVEKHLREQLEQLENELAQYKQKKPWRELLQTEEKPVQPAPKLDDLGAAQNNGTSGSPVDEQNAPPYKASRRPNDSATSDDSQNEEKP